MAPGRATPGRAGEDGRIVLEVRDLSTVYPTDRGDVQAVRGVSLTIRHGDILAIVGESGCGKSATLLSMMRLVPHPGRVIGGSVVLDGRDLMEMPPRAMREVRGRDIAMVFQDPMTTLNPAFRVGDQIAESLRVHGLLPRFPTSLLRASRARERDMVVDLMKKVGIPSPETRHLEYPHQFSGGMQQRILIAIALACKPKVLLADEPTTALDVTVQAQVLDLMREINKATGTAIVLVTHDLAVAAEFCRDLAVMYAGQIVEQGPIDVVLDEPMHPYTRGLLRSVPRLGDRKPLMPIMGEVPDLATLGPGCSFAPRCEIRTAGCDLSAPELLSVGDGRLIRCHAYDN
ncbi:MAG TPA: ABC transporter ATP-binding protein [Firmicutes bacterium]|nr:ABC transporter ATP-binding protein [Bacillota bacterium]